MLNNLRVAGRNTYQIAMSGLLAPSEGHPPEMSSADQHQQGHDDERDRLQNNPSVVHHSIRSNPA
jgi:hypothetical protein